MRNICPSYYCNREEQQDPQLTLYLLRRVKLALDMRCKSLNYQISEHMERARQLAEADEESKMHKRLAMEKLLVRNKYLRVYENVSKLEIQLDSMTVVADYADNMQISNEVFKKLLATANPERIEDLMQEIEDNMIVQTSPQIVYKELPDLPDLEKYELAI